MVQFLSINFFSWISSIFVGFFKSSRFFCVTFINRTTARFPTSTLRLSVKLADFQIIISKLNNALCLESFKFCILARRNYYMDREIKVPI
jgi:hypothetical protein